MKTYTTPLTEADIEEMNVGDMIYISGNVFCGRDAVLPLIVKEIGQGVLDKSVDLHGSVIFHTAVSPAGIGPTSSNKLEIESSIIPLTDAGVRIHLGKGRLKESTIQGLSERKAVYAVIPPVTALLTSKTSEIKCIAHEELGMEAFYRVKANGYPAIVAAAKGRSIYDEL